VEVKQLDVFRDLPEKTEHADTGPLEPVLRLEGRKQPGVSASLRRLRLLERDCAIYQRVHREQR
jgi:hypothetical protein